jgi:uncharacterized protein (TIGR03067 family)
MHAKTLGLFTAAVIVGSFGLTWAGDAKDKGAKALQGAWKAIEGGKDGTTLTFTADKFVLQFKDDSATGTFKVDASKNPKTIDMHITGGTAKVAEKYKGKISLGIFAIEGNKLKWCAGEPGSDDRPTAFPTKDSKTKSLYIIFEREKK